MKFTWLTLDGKWYEKTIENNEEILQFIEWLENNSNIVKWY